MHGLKEAPRKNTTSRILTGEKPETNHEDSKTNPNYGTFYEYGPVFFFLKLKKIAVKDKGSEIVPE